MKRITNVTAGISVVIILIIFISWFFGSSRILFFQNFPSGIFIAFVILVILTGILLYSGDKKRRDLLRAWQEYQIYGQSKNAEYLVSRYGSANFGEQLFNAPIFTFQYKGINMLFNLYLVLFIGYVIFHLL